MYTQATEGATVTHVYASRLGMGDVISLPDDGVRCTVTWADHSVDGKSVQVRIKGHWRRVVMLHISASVQVYETAPRCAHGDRFEHCDRECAWPEELDALYIG